jgi:Leucine-rich repeat (LRR) protein
LKLDVSDNDIKKIDPRPLQYCRDLKLLNLSGNPLKEIHFRTLQKYTKLRRITALEQNFSETENKRKMEHLKEQFKVANLEEHCRLDSSKYGWVISLN